MGRGVNVVPESGGFEPEEVFSLFRAWPRASMFAAPTIVKRLVECVADCPSENIRTIIYGGRADVCRGRAEGARTASVQGSRKSTGRARAR